MTFDKIRTLIANQLNIPEERVHENSRIVEDLGADSLDTVEMLMGLEEEYEMTIPDEDAINLKTVGSIVEYINKHKN